MAEWSRLRSALVVTVALAAVAGCTPSPTPTQITPPATAPLPTLRTRMANERALGISFIYAAQTWRQLAAIFGDTEARALYGLTNVVVVFGGGKDIGFNKEISDLVGTTRVSRTTWQLGRGGGRTASGDDMLILRPEEVRQLPEHQALVIAENTKPIIARLSRCIDGRAGRRLLAQQRDARRELVDGRSVEPVGRGADR